MICPRCEEVKTEVAVDNEHVFSCLSCKLAWQMRPSGGIYFYAYKIKPAYGMGEVFQVPRGALPIFKERLES